MDIITFIMPKVINLHYTLLRHQTYDKTKKRYAEYVYSVNITQTML